MSTKLSSGIYNQVKALWGKTAVDLVKVFGEPVKHVDVNLGGPFYRYERTFYFIHKGEAFTVAAVQKSKGGNNEFALSNYELSERNSYPRSTNAETIEEDSRKKKASWLLYDNDSERKYFSQNPDGSPVHPEEVVKFYGSD